MIYAKIDTVSVEGNLRSEYEDGELRVWVGKDLYFSVQEDSLLKNKEGWRGLCNMVQDIIQGGKASDADTK